MAYDARSNRLRACTVAALAVVIFISISGVCFSAPWIHTIQLGSYLTERGAS